MTLLEELPAPAFPLDVEQLVAATPYIHNAAPEDPDLRHNPGLDSRFVSAALLDYRSQLAGIYPMDVVQDTIAMANLRRNFAVAQSIPERQFRQEVDAPAGGRREPAETQPAESQPTPFDPFEPDTREDTAVVTLEHTTISPVETRAEKLSAARPDIALILEKHPKLVKLVNKGVDIGRLLAAAPDLAAIIEQDPELAVWTIGQRMYAEGIPDYSLDQAVVVRRMLTMMMLDKDTLKAQVDEQQRRREAGIINDAQYHAAVKRLTGENRISKLLAGGILRREFLALSPDLIKEDRVLRQAHDLDYGSTLVLPRIANDKEVPIHVNDLYSPPGRIRGTIERFVPSSRPRPMRPETKHAKSRSEGLSLSRFIRKSKTTGRHRVS